MTVQRSMKKMSVLTAAAGMLLGSAAAVAGQTAIATAAADRSERLGGEDRYATSVAISEHLFPLGAEVVFVANGTDFPDALAGGAGAARLGGPVLLINSARTVPGVVQEELRRLQPKRIYVLGGPSVVGWLPVEILKTLSGAPVERLAGAERYGTAAEVAGLWSSTDTVYVAAGQSYPDALAGGAAAGHQEAPVLLSTPTGLSQATVERLAALAPEQVIVLGGTSVTPASVVDAIKEAVPGTPVNRYAGENRYETAKVVAEQVWPRGSHTAFYATGTDFADALAGIPAAAERGAPLLLVRPHCAPIPTRQITAAMVVTTEYLLGGKAAVNDAATSTPCTTTPPAGPPVTD